MVRLLIMLDRCLRPFTVFAILWAGVSTLAQEPVPAPATPAMSEAPVAPEPPAAEPAIEPDPRINVESGRDVRNWPPDILFDHRHIKIELNVPDVTTPRFSAVQTVTLAPIALARSRIKLDAGKALTFTAAEIDGRPVKFEHDTEEQELIVLFNSPIPPGRQFELRLAYDADKPGGGGRGLTWSKDDSRTPEVDWSIHSQGQPQHNHLWFACHDFPNERVTSEVIATVPAPYEAVSNGRLVGVRKNPGAFVPPPANLEPPKPVEDQEESTLPVAPATTEPPASGTITYHWLQEKPHAYYLIALVIGRFDVVNLGGPDSSVPGLPVTVYGPLGAAEALREAFGNTPDMIAHFSELFDFPYPWEKYAQIMCRNFSAGAMENTSATTFNGNLARGGRRGSIDGIISHELVHQWFGDLVGYKSWEHLWLGEGWATFGEALWAEHEEGEDGYQEAIMQDMGQERNRSARRTAPRHPPMVSNRYRTADSRFSSPDNVYQKGGVILHMLRQRLGDEVFWKGARLYLKRHAYQQVETDDFRMVMEEASGQSLERFFDQWCRRPGHPSLEVDYSWKPATEGDEAAGELTVTVDQVQRVDADNPAYAFQLPVYAKFDEGAISDGEYLYLTCDSRSTTMTFRLPSRPASMSIDPYLTVLCRKKVRQSLEAAMDQLRHGTTYAARMQAIDTLAGSPSLPALGALLQSAVDGSHVGAPPRDRRMAGRSAAAAASMLRDGPALFQRSVTEFVRRVEFRIAESRVSAR